VLAEFGLGQAGGEAVNADIDTDERVDAVANFRRHGASRKLIRAERRTLPPLVLPYLPRFFGG
jgi:hypothetical protein